MLYFDLIFGGVLAVVAFVCLLVSIEEPGCLVVFVVFGVLGGFLLSAGVHRDWARGRAAHVALYHAATAEGYHVRSDDVHSNYGASIDVRAGRCKFSLEARKIDGRWRFGVDESGLASSGGIVYLSPADVAKFAAVCPA